MPWRKMAKARRGGKGSEEAEDEVPCLQLPRKTVQGVCSSAFGADPAVVAVRSFDIAPSGGELLLKMCVYFIPTLLWISLDFSPSPFFLACLSSFSLLRFAQRRLSSSQPPPPACLPACLPAFPHPGSPDLFPVCFLEKKI